MIGFAMENGPFIIDNEEFVENVYSWNKNANVIYFDHPTNVGFSGCDSNWTQSTCESAWTDAQDAVFNNMFLNLWYTEFPEYRNSDLYIAGESYGGISVPWLAWKID